MTALYKRFVMKTLFSVLLMLMLVSCATLMGDRTVNVTGDQIAEKLNEKLAVPISLMKIFDINLSNALVTFDQKSGRMQTVMDTKLSSQLFDESVAGHIGISGKLRFDAVKQAVVLDAPKIDNLTFDETDSKFNQVLNALAAEVGGELLNGLTLYKVKPEDLQFAGTQYSPKDMIVTDQGLQLTLSPQ